MTQDKPRFSVVFLTWNGGKDAERAVASVLENSYEKIEIIIVDNNSDDNTVENLISRFSNHDRVSIYENNRNYGFSNGMNRGVNKATGDYICCYNQDTYFPNDYFSTIAEVISPNAVWTTSRKNYRVSKDKTCVRLRHKHGFSVPYIVDGLSGVTELNYLPGDGVIIPRGIYEDILDELTFDPRMKVRGEDVDLGLRVLNSEVPIFAILDTYSIHPDQSDLYRPSIDTLNIYIHSHLATIQAYRNNNYSRLLVFQFLLGMFIFPVFVYTQPFPRSMEDFFLHVERKNEGIADYYLKREFNPL